jgi:hypothetical protein
MGNSGITNEQLLGYLFDDKPHILAHAMSDWIGAAPRFKAFATTYRDKIRKKIRITQNDTAIKDLEVELETAYWLLQEKRFTVAYEPYNSQKIRGADFAVTFKAITFNVEVTRIGSREGKQPLSELEEAPDVQPDTQPDPQHAGGRLTDTVCDKFGQMRPGMVNVLVVVADSDFVHLLDLNQAMTRLKERAEQKEAGLFGRYGLVKTADFFKYYLRLSAILVRPAGEQEGTTRSMLWINNQAKQPLPGPLRTILQRT